MKTEITIKLCIVFDGDINGYRLQIARNILGVLDTEENKAAIETGHTLVSSIHVTELISDRTLSTLD
ncbi:hypothetical protein [Spirosoma sordidisoli]|uniref:Uncharacterized protein n=1 Tax=Spirosoma sordidisoli TaxID=2502893 RepID=A0A4Q2UPR0_9BACT|nr:hypothetical protein [Spirosoma sordidisoli]RYC69600.1 hypothetical protein EQG79_13435 [Spirosoma sordidisoli]